MMQVDDTHTPTLIDIPSSPKELDARIRELKKEQDELKLAFQKLEQAERREKIAKLAGKWRISRRMDQKAVVIERIVDLDETNPLNITRVNIIYYSMIFSPNFQLSIYTTDLNYEQVIRTSAQWKDFKEVREDLIKFEKRMGELMDKFQMPISRPPSTQEP